MGKKKNEEQELVDPNSTSYSLVQADNFGRYSLGDKLLAITFLETSQRARNGELVPTYEKISQLLEVPATTLQGWWSNKDAITKQADSAVGAMNQAASIGMITEAVKILNSFRKTDWEKVGIKNKLEALKTLIPNSRLLAGKSTGKFEHEHSHFFSPIPPKRS